MTKCSCAHVASGVVSDAMMVALFAAVAVVAASFASRYFPINIASSQGSTTLNLFK